MVMLLLASPMCAATEADDSLGTPSKPNVLLIVVDDLRPELGCYGNRHIRSPHIDQLSREGLLFERAYCQEAVCMSSRNSMLSGYRPDSKEIWTNRDVRPLLQDIDLLPAHFRKHGYHAVGIGKVAHNGWEDSRSWSEPHRMPANAPYEYRTRAGRALVRKMQREAAAAGRPDPFQGIAEKIRRGMPFESLDVGDSELGDGQIADQAVAALNRLQDRRFFLAVGFLRPHLPFVAPKQYWDLYDPQALPSAEIDALPLGTPRVADNRSRELLLQYRGLPRKPPLDPDLATRLVHGYYACVSYVDAQIGRLLDGLRGLNLADNTVVILTSDHGWHLGDHGMWGKATVFEKATRVPLIIRAPNMTAQGTSTDSLVELVGLYPTLCDLAGLPKPRHLQGASFAKLLDRPELTLRRTALSQYPRGDLMGYSVRTEHYRYTEWRRMGSDQPLYRELYDHRLRSLEDRNLADRPDLATTVHDLSELLNGSLRDGIFD